MLPARCCSPPAPARAQVKKFADSRNRVPCLGLAVAASTSPTGTPNLVFMLQDDLGFNDVGFTSGTPSTEPAATANITALARSGSGVALSLGYQSDRRRAVVVEAILPI